MYICDVYQSSLKFYCQRFSNNATPTFTDQELLTVFLSAEHINAILASKRYIHSPKNICFHGFLTFLLIKHSTIG